jgi:hypothetical protein
VVKPPQVTVTIDEIVVDRGEDVEAALRAELESQPVDADRVAAAVAAAVDEEVGS